MRTALFYDTETTGIPEYNLPSDDPVQPHIIQLAADLVDLDTRRSIAAINTLIKPTSWVVPAEVEALTGITTERAAMFGLDIRVVLPMFLSLWNMATEYRVAHGEQFDNRITRIAIKRDGSFSDAFADQWKKAPAFCTCQEAKTIVNLPPSEKMAARGMKGPKLPNLGEAYKFFTGQDLQDAHDAAADVAACKVVFFGIVEHRLRQAAA
ncbi:exonuclease domain-containing protein [Herbaspirillum sp. WKF16]|uniref:3'-5' exonuclease n=1 Tax=Herbaspirillum sp. WKF16 TaxID=3028312 RepID=UPI0023A97F21|nr:exonuclease domain-containing protein [Herbaspirillum sp. WKF16]WDZ97941.1 exonuclease domain-containing protein [Herbaspirillum sp. WKF16]